MLKLKNVSKFYYSKGVIASGISKINIELKLGEFVVITGESGSGKTTLLNIISGLDSYEEGEMYINGEETSHYQESEFEFYRKKYVSNIFQAFNLVNSYTVYQNVELVMLLNGYKKKDIKDRVLSLIDTVGLMKHKNTKVSKLSGGEKQRVAIARALAKDTPIIVCDEPTGNLDSKAAKEIIKLLKEVSKDKLLVMVTHDYDSVKEYATRVIQMGDGKIISDKKVSAENNEIKKDDYLVKNIGGFNIFRLGFRNTFNILPKFLLILVVFLFICVSLFSEYSSLKKLEYETDNTGDNYYFSDLSDKRIIVNKSDRTTFSDEELDNVNKINNVSLVVANDYILDNFAWFESVDGNYYYVNGILNDISSFEGELSYGRMPEKKNEVLILTNKDDYYFSDLLEESVKATYYLNSDINTLGIKVVGVAYRKGNGYYDNNLYFTSEYLEDYMMNIHKDYSSSRIKINGNYYNDIYYVKSNRLKSGEAYFPENNGYMCKDYNCKNSSLSFEISNLYYSDSINLKVTNVYNNKNSKKLLGISEDGYGYGAIFISEEDYNKLFDKGVYQISVFADDGNNVDSVENDLINLGFNTLQMRKTFSNSGSDLAKVLKIIRLVTVVGLIIVLFFISYFVIKLILKSRNVYYATLRILGANYKNVKRILITELLVSSTMAFVIFMGFVVANYYGVIKIDFISNNLLKFMMYYDYILIYIILLGMSYLISSRYARKIFKNSAMKSYREEV